LLAQNVAKIAWVLSLSSWPPFMSDRLFGYVKRNLMGYRAENLSELLVCIQVILRSISGERSVEMFLEWMKRLQ
jgi:hypothetical protein